MEEIATPSERSQGSTTVSWAEHLGGSLIGRVAYWAAICGDGEGGFEDPVAFWRQLLTEKERTGEDILHDAWKGPGNMWFVR